MEIGHSAKHIYVVNEEEHCLITNSIHISPSLWKTQSNSVEPLNSVPFLAKRSSESSYRRTRVGNPKPKPSQKDSWQTHGMWQESGAMFILHHAVHCKCFDYTLLSLDCLRFSPLLLETVPKRAELRRKLNFSPWNSNHWKPFSHLVLFINNQSYVLY